MKELKPKKPTKFMVSFPPELHRELKIYSAKSMKDMNFLIVEAVKQLIK